MVLSGYEIAEILCQAGTAVAATLDREVAIERILEQLAQVVPYDSASVQLLREGYLEIVGGRGWSDPESVVGLRFPVPGDNPNTIVIQERRPHILDDAPGPYTTFVGTSSHIRSWLGVPLIIHDRVIGMLTVDSTQPDYFTSDHARLVTALASQVSVAIENSRLYAQVQQRVAELEAVRRTSLKLSSSLDLPDVLDSVAESALDLVGATDCIIYLYDQESDSFSFGTARGGWLEKDRVTLPRRGGMTSAGYHPQEIMGQHIDVLYAELGEGIDIHQTTIEQGHCMREVTNAFQDADRAGVSSPACAGRPFGGGSCAGGGP